ncbi:replication initiation and membrane attachment family protein [Paenactinomyces guangxiensis]|uniref:DnaD domain protein n=1 Tax=Paenactinomyces guangxiensis TaxID=1490290 RepID=A0A7W1WUR7_9BACL|nr:DnaD domain protein [Paenactinomyces guangxiensis]MBA4496455.1 DnaD domain protein [Paenactinomyces guangxiensis]MBH8593571.1 DnaD domain protein [Paenactinomyces guangxiensis]
MAMFWKDAGWCCRTRRPIHHGDLLGLTHLYQPIVGTAAIALYMTLAFQLPLHRAGVTNIHRHSYLLQLCSLSFDQMSEARYLLEGVGLLNTYEKKDPEHGRFYEYEVVPPLTPAKFFQSDVLSLTLFNLLGKEQYLAIRKQLVDPGEAENRSDHIQVTNVTKSFQDVFGSLSPVDMAKAVEMEKEAVWEMGKIDESLVDGQFPQLNEEDELSMIRMRLSSIVDEEVWTDQLIAELREIRFLYQLDDWDLLKALQNPYVTRHGKIDMDRLRSFVKSEYRLRFGGPPIISKRKSKLRALETPHPASDKAQDQTALTEEEKHFQQLAEISPLELLSAYQGGARIPDSDVELVESLVRHYGLPHGVINVLLEYVLLKYNYKLPRNLVEKIAGHWKRLGVQTVEEALKQARKENWEIKRKRPEPKAAGKTGRTPARGEKLPRTVLKQMQANAETEQSESMENREDLAEKQARIQAKLKLMNERLSARKHDKENTP